MISKDKKKEYDKQYYLKNKDKKKIQTKNYYYNNIEKISEYNKLFGSEKQRRYRNTEKGRRSRKSATLEGCR